MPDETAVETQQEQEQAESTAKADETEQAAASAAAETSETQTDQSAGDGQKPPEKGGVQRRIDELTKARRLAEAEAEFWRQKALGEAAGDKSPQKADDKEPKEPNPEDFETTGEYLKAVRAFDREMLKRELQTQLQKAEQEREQKTEQEIINETWAEKEEPLKEKLPDYKAVADSAMDAIEQSLLSSKRAGDQQTVAAMAAIAHTLPLLEAGPEVLYYLGQHPEEIKRLAGMHPTRVVGALHVIEARLAPETEGGERPPQTKAPKPPTPIRKAAAGTTLDPDNPDDAAKMTAEEWAKARTAKLRGR